MAPFYIFLQFFWKGVGGMVALHKVTDAFSGVNARVRFILSMFAAFSTTQIVSATSIPVFAEESDSSNAFSTHVDTSGNAVDVLAKIFNQFVAPLQNLGAVLLILSAVVCGIKIGVSAMTSDPRSRTEAIMGIFFIIVGAVMIIHVRSLVGMAVGLNNKAGR